MPTTKVPSTTSSPWCCRGYRIEVKNPCLKNKWYHFGTPLSSAFFLTACKYIKNRLPVYSHLQTGRRFIQPHTTSTQHPIPQRITNIHPIPSKASIPPIHAILMPSFLYFYAERVYNYAIRHHQNANKDSYLTADSEPPLLNIRSIAPKHPPIFSCTPPDSLLRTSGSSPKLKRMFRTGRGKSLHSRPVLQSIPLPFFTLPFVYICRNILIKNPLYLMK